MLVRQSLREILSANESFEIRAEAGNGVDTIKAVKTHKPDLLVLDAAMPQVTGVEVIEEVQRWSPDTAIAVVTGSGSLDLLQHIVDSGVAGIFLKSEATMSWAEDFLAICQGGTRVSDALAEKLESRLTDNDLTRRERQVLFAIARGESNMFIADRLGISANTVDKYRTSLMRKFQVHSSAQLVTRAFKDGLLDQSDLN